VAELHGVQLVVEAMKKFSSEAEIQDKGCGMIRNMAIGAIDKSVISSVIINQVALISLYWIHS
jgi:hypothetical protein